MTSNVAEARFVLPPGSEAGVPPEARGLARDQVRMAVVTADRLSFEDIDLRRATRAQWRELRGGRIGMVLQDPKYSLNPVMRVGAQIEESLRDHQGLRGRAASSTS